MDLELRKDVRAGTAWGVVGRHGLRGLGVLAFAIGTVGIFVPLLPTTIFWIAAAACFARSEPRWQRWIFEHPRFGAPVRDYLRAGVVRREAKLAAIAGLAASFCITAFVSGLNLVGLCVLAATLTAVAVYVVSRPERLPPSLSPDGAASPRPTPPLS
ncbi:MAG: YbaN family protein [Rhodospirillaceae bacterium]|nr:YbaN family protein [Rhodospirillaceae bacterium]